MTLSGSGPHNSIYRGKSLGSSVTSEQWAAISAGTFEDLYIGDYWTIGRVNWRIAAFDYYYNAGDTNCTTHHVVIVPDTRLYTHTMNEEDTTADAYVGSKMYTEGLESAKTTINSAFSGHVLSHRVYLAKAVTNGYPSASAWYDSTVELMNENMVYGNRQRSPMSTGSITVMNATVEKSQLPLFALNPRMANIRVDYWLRDVASASAFAYVSNVGLASYTSASSAFGVRPAFCIS